MVMLWSITVALDNGIIRSATVVRWPRAGERAHIDIGVARVSDRNRTELWAAA